MVIKLNNNLLIILKSIYYPIRLVRGHSKEPLDIIRFKFLKIFLLKYYLFYLFISIYERSIYDRVIFK
jgi:hypothetical protein